MPYRATVWHNKSFVKPCFSTQSLLRSSSKNREEEGLPNFSREIEGDSARRVVLQLKDILRVTAPCLLGNKLLNIQFVNYHIWNNKSEGFPNMVLSTETFNQSVRTGYSEAVNARYTFQPLWVSDRV